MNCPGLNILIVQSMTLDRGGLVTHLIERRNQGRNLSHLLTQTVGRTHTQYGHGGKDTQEMDPQLSGPTLFLRCISQPPLHLIPAVRPPPRLLLPRLHRPLAHTVHRPPLLRGGGRQPPALPPAWFLPLLSPPPPPPGPPPHLHLPPHQSRLCFPPPRRPCLRLRNISFLQPQLHPAGVASSLQRRYQEDFKFPSNALCPTPGSSCSCSYFS